MRTQRTVDEIADAILPADGDGLHERALCLLLAEHEAKACVMELAIETLSAQLRARCEPGEEGQGRALAARHEAAPAGANVRTADSRAPGSTAPAPTHEWQHDTLQPAPPQWETDARWMEVFGGDCGPGIAKRLRALAADRDRLARIVAKDQEWAALASCNSVQEMHAELGHQIGQHREAVSDRNLLADNLEEMQRERDALQRRITAMSKREPTRDDLDYIADLTEVADWKIRVWRYCRNQILAAPESEPSEGPPMGCTDSWPSRTCERGTDGCSVTHPVEYNRAPSAAPQPSPATPSEVIGWYDILNSAAEAGYTRMEAQARAVASEVARREAALREELAAARAQLAAATESERMWREGFTTAVLTLRSHSDVYEAWRVLNHRSKS